MVSQVERPDAEVPVDPVSFGRYQSHEAAPPFSPANLLQQADTEAIPDTKLLWRRLGARSIDVCVWFVILIVVMLGVIASRIPEESENAPMILGWYAIVLAIEVGARGWSPGKMLLKLKVVDTGGAKPGFGRSLIRAVPLAFSLALFPLALVPDPDAPSPFWIAFTGILSMLVLVALPLLSLITANRDKRGRALWDMLSGTQVVRR